MWAYEKSADEIVNYSFSGKENFALLANADTSIIFKLSILFHLHYFTNEIIKYFTLNVFWVLEQKNNI